MIVGDYTIPPEPVTTVPSGRTALLIIDDTYDDRDAVPATFVNRVEATFGPMPPGQAEFANNFQDQVTQLTAATQVGDGRPVVIGPPLTGDSWVAVNVCCELLAHRGRCCQSPGGSRLGAIRHRLVAVRPDRLSDRRLRHRNPWTDSCH